MRLVLTNTSAMNIIFTSVSETAVLRNVDHSRGTEPCYPAAHLLPGNGRSRQRAGNLAGNVVAKLYDAAGQSNMLVVLVPTFTMSEGTRHVLNITSYL